MSRPPRFGVYVHWPYCARICPYCDFNVRRHRGEGADALITAIAEDLREHRRRIGQRTAETVFLGGGTPSLLSGGEVGRLLAAVDAAFPIAADAEISLEANPEDRGGYSALVAAGVNRLSIGVQSLRDEALKSLFRLHDGAGARAAVEAAAATGARVSADLIYARPNQSLADWRAELAEALALPVEHLSLYQLTVEAGTAFDRAARRGRLVPPDAELAAAFYEETQAACAAAGLPAYEISNHARGEAARARHNVLYWSGGEWVGVGPGAHGRVFIEGARWATEAEAGIGEYLASVAARGVGWATCERLTPAASGEEHLALGLRLAEGVDEGALTAAWGRSVDEATAASLVAEGLLARADGRIALTPAGRLVADRIVAALALT